MLLFLVFGLFITREKDDEQEKINEDYRDFQN
jgi:hypothetical protein